MTMTQPSLSFRILTNGILGSNKLEEELNSSQNLQKTTSAHHSKKEKETRMNDISQSLQRTKYSLFSTKIPSSLQSPSVFVVDPVVEESRIGVPLKEILDVDSFSESEPLESIHFRLMDNGQMYERRQDYLSAIESYEKSKSVALSILTNSTTRNTLPLAISLKAIGDIYEKQCRYEFALQYYIAAIPYYSQSGKHTFHLLGYIYKNIAFIYGYKMNNIKKSTQYYNYAMKVFQLCHGIQHEMTQRCLLDIKEVEKYHCLQMNDDMKKKRKIRRGATRSRRRRQGTRG